MNQKIALLAALPITAMGFLGTVSSAQAAALTANEGTMSIGSGANVNVKIKDVLGNNNFSNPATLLDDRISFDFLGTGAPAGSGNYIVTNNDLVPDAFVNFPDGPRIGGIYDHTQSLATYITAPPTGGSPVAFSTPFKLLSLEPTPPVLAGTPANPTCVGGAGEDYFCAKTVNYFAIIPTFGPAGAPANTRRPTFINITVGGQWYDSERSLWRDGTVSFQVNRVDISTNQFITQAYSSNGINTSWAGSADIKKVPKVEVPEPNTGAAAIIFGLLPAFKKLKNRNKKS
jgi:hypothetical protein